MKSITALAAVVVTGLPPKVEIVEPLKESATSGVRHRQADGLAVAEALGAGDDVGRDAVLLDAEPLAAGASPAGLHLVADEEAVVARTISATIREYSLGGVMKPPTP